MPEDLQAKQAALAAIQVPADVAAIPMGPNNYRRMVYQGSTPEQARNIVLQSTGLPHDRVAGTAATQASTNEARKYEQFRDPACPPDAPYRPDPNHWKSQGMHWMDGPPPTDACLEKPQDWDKDSVKKGYMTPGGWKQGSGMPPGGGGGGAQPAQPAAPQPGSGLYNPNDPLQNQLVSQFQKQGGVFGAQDMTQGKALAGGGIWSWGEPVAGAGGPAAPANPANPLAPQAAKKPVGIGGYMSAANPFAAAASQPATQPPGAMPGGNPFSPPSLEETMMKKFRKPGMTRGPLKV